MGHYFLGCPKVGHYFWGTPKVGHYFLGVPPKWVTIFTGAFHVESSIFSDFLFPDKGVGMEK